MKLTLNVEEIWEQAEWVEHSRKIIENLHKFPEDSKIIMILRHSHRNDPIDMEKVHKLRLTPQGHAIARKFGELLPTNREIRLFHSVIWRCEETAENIQKGFESIGGKTELKGILAPLYQIGIDDVTFLRLFKNYHFRDLLFRWVAGFYLPEEWAPFIPYCQNAANLIWNQLETAPEKGIDICVSHDWQCLSLRYGWFGFPPDNRWIRYLGGYAFSFEKDHILLLDYGELKKIEIPHWWKSKQES
ncbi:MAG: hypothetical protein ACW986_07280 [Promethearchaeota archaeon]